MSWASRVQALTGRTTAISAPFASVNGPTSDPFGGAKMEGWSVTCPFLPTLPVPVPFTVFRQGYSGTDSATANTMVAGSVMDTFYLTRTIRQSAPNNASQSALLAAMSDYVYSTDVVCGVPTNNSTLISPKPIVKWGLPGRRTCGNTVRLEVVAFHKDARRNRQIAGVVFTATDGTHTSTATVVTPTVLGYTGDLNAVIGYGVDLDISGLNDSASFTVDAVAYPWIGAAASLRSSADGTAANFYEFATQTYLRSTSKAATPPIVYVITGGVDGTVDANGVLSGNTKVSTTDATAKANPFATIKSALEALKAATAITGGVSDGCEVRISNSTIDVGSALAAGTYQTTSEVVITRDPAVAKASCIFTFGVATSNLRHTMVKIRDLTVSRGGTNQLGVLANGQCVIENCDFDNTSRASQIVGSSTGNVCWLGAVVSNATSQMMSAGTTPQGIVRGVSGSGLQVETGCIIGCNFTGNTVAVFSATRTLANIVLAFNKFNNITSTTVTADANDKDGFAVVQNLFEFISATANPSLRISGDDASNNITHCVIHNNTFVGEHAAGRQNIFYDETNNVRRTHKLNSYRGNLAVSQYHKTDLFHYSNDANPEGYDAGNPSQAIGNWAFLYGVGCAYNFTNYTTAAPSVESPLYTGRGSLDGTATATPQIAVASLFTAFAATTWNGSAYTAGAGGGTYTLVAGSAVLGINPEPTLIATLDGTVRSATNDNLGALKAA